MRAKLAMCAIGLLSAATMFAHHSFSAEFDATKTVNLKGNVTKVDWLNPHIWIYLDVKDDTGKVVHWQCEGGAPNSLTRNGWTKNDLKKGDAIEIDGTLAKDASNTCNASRVALPDGRRVFAGSSNPNLKQP
jgi:Family of unknown function (DUF6152)